MKFCVKCGAYIFEEAEICPKCGVRQPAFKTSGNRNRITAALLAMFLGGFGVHKFYLGRSGQGVVYLLFCWTFLPAIIGFLEGITYLSMSEQAFSEKYNK